ncbi:ribonuclease E inhibitor RraB [Nevskia sp.]|uniref:ribonuclease E inhibitor RraB n=1 Tax=Nevskia sp. TaxID=1929292 RepID=UPI0025E00CE2|nr:ribonuclease E inhibitor RraB [Nevskia sp.]
MIFGIAIAILGVGALGYWWENQMFFAGTDIALEWFKTYEFSFSAAFRSSDGAQKALSAKVADGLTAKLKEPGEFNKNWHVSWVIEAKPRRLRIAKLQAALDAVAQAHDCLGGGVMLSFGVPRTPVI